MKIKWRNRYSGEEGYVKSISTKGGHFVNTYEIREACEYKTEAAYKKAIKMLEKYGETKNNEFEPVQGQM